MNSANNHSSVLDTEVLKLNKNWQVLGTVSVRQSVSDLAAGAATVLRFEGGYPTPYRWADWVGLPVADKTDFIGLSHDRKMNVPRVIIMVKFNKLIVKPPKLTLKNLRKRDDDTCAYTGQKLKPGEMSKEHVIPVSKGGKTTWENIVLAHRDVNSRRGNLPLEEAGLTLRCKPVAPRGQRPEEQLVAKYPEWELFIKA